MFTINSIVEEMKELPVGKLEEVYQFVHSLTPKVKKSESKRKKILSFAGAFKDMNNVDYDDYLEQTKKIRNQSFNRNIDL